LIRQPRGDELEEIAAFVAAQQRRPESRDAMFDEKPDAIAAQLSTWTTAWTETSRVVDRERGVAGFVGADLDESLSRTWIHGPIVDAPHDRDWDGAADALFAALESELPQTRRKEAEIAADVANESIARFAGRHGFVAGKVHHLLAVAAHDIEKLPRNAVAPVARDHEAAFVSLHDELFPGSYYSGSQLLEQASRDDAVVLELVEDGVLAGYAAGRIDESGDGYLDFVGVAADRRCRGLGRTLVGGMAHALCDRAPIAAMRLTVSSENSSALVLYEKLGFGRQSSAVGYRRPPESRA
jgi:ribosomal protein S18 acetylase RimI-like enzyme